LRQVWDQQPVWIQVNRQIHGEVGDQLKEDIGGWYTV
jgi:hypothetical protein